MNGHCFVVSGDQGAARDIVHGILTDQGFALKRIDEWSADAERGSSGKSIILGAFAGKKGRHVKLQITCQPDQEGFTITLTEGTSGASGGLIGIGQANSIYAGVYNAVSAALKNAGVLISDKPSGPNWDQRKS